MNNIEKRVTELINEYGSAEPEVICEGMGLIIVVHELPQHVNGFTVRMNGIPFIVLNSSLDYYRSRVTTAHELGHIVLHGATNSIELSCNTGFCVSRFEREADCFAAHLLMKAELSSFEGRESLTTEDVSKMAHIPMEMVENAFTS